MTRDQYIPAGSQEIRDSASDAVAYIAKGARGGFHVIAFTGRKNSPDLNAGYIAQLDAMAARRVHQLFKRRRDEMAKAKSGHPLKVGDILVSSWGYEQTNVDFYTVEALNGLTQVTLQKVGTSTTEDRPLAMTGKALPDRSVRLGKPFRRKVDAEGLIKLAYSWARRWDGKPKACSWYG
jgi:hypothetical protein